MCVLCPRRCGRSSGGKAYCGGGRLRLAAASIHRGEEPPITGNGGSGAIFVSGCNLRCVFCQNSQISRDGMGRAVGAAEFAAICIALQKHGAENINIVTGSHAVPAIVKGILRARRDSLAIPCVWNSSAYEKNETLELLRDVADIYVPDLKTLDEDIAGAFFNAPDYPFYAEKAILKMIEMAGDKNKVIIRHLVLPGFLESTKKVLKWFATAASGKAMLSLMTQYTPPVSSSGAPGRFLDNKEYETVLSWLYEFGIEDGFYQELQCGYEWLPDFSRKNPFSSELSVPVWHWKHGFL